MKSPLPAVLWSLLLFALVLNPARLLAQNPLANGGAHAGEISPAGDSDSWTFQAPAGAGIFLRAGSPILTPKIRLFGPDNAPLGESTWFNAATRDGSLSFVAPVAGTYTVLVSAAYPTQVGAYTLHLALAPGAITVPAQDEGGDLVNGVDYPGTLSVGDLDVFSFTAAAGESLWVRAGSTAATPWIRLYQPNGALIAESTWFNAATRDGWITVRLTNAGPHTVVVSAAYAGQSGPYTISSARAPGGLSVAAGDQGGDLANGAATAGTLPVGDLDAWSFTGAVGDHVTLRMGSPSVTPWVRLYGPDGALVGESSWFNAATRDGLISVRLTQAGAYTAVVGAAYASQDGDYTLHRAQAPGDIVTSPGDEGGNLANGAAKTGNLTVGDIDVWRFNAAAGEHIDLRMGGTNVTPFVEIYDPSGSLAGQSTWFNAATRDGSIATVATNAGSYTVLVSAVYSGQSGSYGLHLARTPAEFEVSEGDEGGDLANGVGEAANLTLGDMDLWRFDAAAGESVLLRMASTSVTPWLRLFGPDGVQVGESTWFNAATRDGVIQMRLAASGTYTVIAAAVYAGQSGDYTLHRASIPGLFSVSASDEGGPLVNGLTNNAAMPLGDLDMWSFVGTPGDSNVFRVTGNGITPWLTVFAPDGAMIRESTYFNASTREATVTLPITNAGLYTIVMTARYPGQSGSYQFKQSRVPPDLIHPEQVVVAEGATVDFALSAQDPDEPNKPLVFALQSAPPGMTLTVQGATNAQVTWPTSEATGPSTNVVVATVTDTVNGRAFTRTNSISVVVQEVNLPPVLTVPADRVIEEETALTASASATDADLPANPLTFSLASAPEGMTIDPATGEIRWTPTEAQGPSENTVSVVVTDFSPSAVNDQRLSVTNTFRVVVREVNVPPSLTVPPSLAIDELAVFAAAAQASDRDLPANPLTFRLALAPAGLVIDPATGALSWTPSEQQGPSDNPVEVVVTDASPQAANATQLSATNRFVLTVREVNTPPVLSSTADFAMAEGEPVTVQHRAPDADIPVNTVTFSLASAPAGAAIGADGTVTWTAGESDGSTTNRFLVVARDNGTPSLSVTNAFSVVVREVNSAPVLTVPPDQSLDEGAPLAVSVSATDADLPANPLTYRLLNAPEGMTIQSGTGAIGWTPSEVHGGTTVTITVVVTDSNPTALDATALSVTNSFRVAVKEVNVAPVPAAIADVSVHYGSPVALTVNAVDTDFPRNILSYALDRAPEGMTVDLRTGALAWTPPQSAVGTHPVTVRVTDDGEPAQSGTVSFQVTVFGAGSRLELSTLGGGLKQVSSTGEVGLDYELQASTDLVVWDRLVDFRMTAAPYVYIDPGSTTAPLRFYRLRLRQP